MELKQGGTVISDVLPVITLTALVAKKTITSRKIFNGLISLSYVRWPAYAGTTLDRFQRLLQPIPQDWARTSRGDGLVPIW